MESNLPIPLYPRHASDQFIMRSISEMAQRVDAAPIALFGVAGLQTAGVAPFGSPNL
jgi:hypothetical protein